MPLCPTSTKVTRAATDNALPSGVEDDLDTASDTKMVWAKSTLGVWGLANIFANEKLYFTRDVPHADGLPRGQQTPAKLATQPVPLAKSAAKLAAKVAATPAAREPIPVANVEYVQLFKASTALEKVANSFLVFLWIACPYFCTSCFVSHVPCFPPRGGGVRLRLCLRQRQLLRPVCPYLPCTTAS